MRNQTETIESYQLANTLLIIVLVLSFVFFWGKPMYNWFTNLGAAEAQLEYYEKNGITIESFTKYKNDAAHFEAAYKACLEK